MKPFTSKHCTQYLTKESPLNQGLIFKDQDPNDPKVQESIRRMIDEREKRMGKTKPILEQASKKLANKKIKEIGFKPGSKADEATLKRMSSKKYK